MGDVRKLEKQFENLYQTTYKFYPPLFISVMIVGNFLYFSYEEHHYKTCANFNQQFVNLTNFCTFIFCVGYVMIVYYLSIWVSVICFKKQTNSEQDIDDSSINHEDL